MNIVKSFLKSEAVLTVSFILAAVSAFFVPPCGDYLGYIDFRTLSLLFCLMAVTSGFKSMGIFGFLGEKLLSRVKNTRQLSFTLFMLCFFFSMIITNDVALITFVPFSIVTLKMSQKEKLLIPVIVMETIAANLGSMMTPVGNPQNLYLFSAFQMEIKEFFLSILPYGLLSMALTAVSVLFIKKETVAAYSDKTESYDFDKRKIALYSVLFVLALLTVFRVVPYYVTLAVTAAAFAAADRKTFKKIDYSLLFTFVFLFVFIGNLGNISAVSSFLEKLVSGNEVITGIVSSQVFSNVPAAILLSGFTKNASDLMIGVNIGGLGTLIASMASLISFKFIAKEKVNTLKYLIVFTVLNIVFLAFNTALWLIIK